MTAYTFTVEVAVGSDTGPMALQRLSVAFERAGDAVKDWGRYVFPKLVPVFEDAIEEQFAGRGAGPAGPWAPLSPTYAEWKARKAPGMPLMELSGNMREALTRSSSPMAWREWSADSFSFGTVGLSYVSHHQTGTSRMPARPLFDFGPRFEVALMGAAQAGLREAIREGSRGTLEAA